MNGHPIEVTDALWEAMARSRANPYILAYGGSVEDACVATNPSNGECWQYVGNSQFRHRCHPATGARIVLTVQEGATS